MLNVNRPNVIMLSIVMQSFVECHYAVFCSVIMLGIVLVCFVNFDYAECYYAVFSRVSLC
jgi:hypothetical protein